MRAWAGRPFPIIKQNTIAHNTVGISIGVRWQLDGDPNEFKVPVIIVNNNIHSNSIYNVVGTGIINATHNYWGSSQGVVIQSTVSDSVYIQPILSNPNPQAQLILDTNPTPFPSPEITPTPLGVTPTPYQENQEPNPPVISIDLEVITPILIVVVVVGASIGLLLYLRKKL